MPPWTQYAIGAGIAWAVLLQVRKDANGLGRKQRAMLAEMLIEKAEDPEAVRRIAENLVR